MTFWLFSMARDINRLTQGQYDVLIVGGGINGAAIANMASLNGLRVALLEKEDFASGTSSKSTKLIHGGLRYLENFEFDLVRESLIERFVLLKSAPHLIRPLQFIIPIYKTDVKPFWLVRFGVWFYDFLSGKYLLKKHRALTPQEVVEEIPDIDQENLVGGVAYYDAQMDDARLCLENILSAQEQGADVANYVEVKSLIKENGKVVGVHAYDVMGKSSFDVHARKVVCAIGPWTNIFAHKEQSQSPPRVRMSKGAHIIYRGKVSSKAVIIPTRKDKRVFFLIPWHGNTLMGTTDTEFQGDPSHVQIEESDIDYILKEVGRIFPQKDFKKEDIVSTFVGLRPLVYKEGATAKVSRKHVVKESFSGIIYIVGGKYTTYRKVAESCVRMLLSGKLINTDQRFSVYGAGRMNESVYQLSKEFDLDKKIVQNLMNVYGSRCKDVLRLVEQDGSLKKKICLCSDVIAAQIKYAIDVEMAQTPEDIILRRTPLVYSECSDLRCRKAIQKFFG